jgi:hypothetical protein
LKISPRIPGLFEPGYARPLYCLRNQHRMADWHRQVAAIAPTRLTSRGNNRRAQRCQIKRRACRLIDPCPPASRSPCSEGFAAKPKAVIVELAEFECGALTAARTVSRERSRPNPVFRPGITPPSVLAKARTERVEDAPAKAVICTITAPADCPNIHLNH